MSNGGEKRSDGKERRNEAVGGAGPGAGSSARRLKMAFSPVSPSTSLFSSHTPSVGRGPRGTTQKLTYVPE